MAPHPRPAKTPIRMMRPGSPGERVLEADHDQRAGDTGERHHRALRKIEAADDEDQHLAGGDDDEIGRTAQHVEKVLHGDKVRNEERERNEQHRQQDREESGGVIGPQNPLENPRRQRTHRWSICRSLRFQSVPAYAGAFAATFLAASSALPLAEEMRQHCRFVDVGPGEFGRHVAIDA